MLNVACIMYTIFIYLTFDLFPKKFKCLLLLAGNYFVHSAPKRTEWMHFKIKCTLLVLLLFFAVLMPSGSGGGNDGDVGIQLALVHMVSDFEHQMPSASMKFIQCEKCIRRDGKKLLTTTTVRHQINYSDFIYRMRRAEKENNCTTIYLISLAVVSFRILFSLEISL